MKIHAKMRKVRETELGHARCPGVLGIVKTRLKGFLLLKAT